MCGGLAVEIDGARIEDELAGRQGRELFAYLAVHRDRAVGREELLGVLWPRRAPRSPEAGLSTVLARLRRVLGHGMLSGRAQLRLNAPPGTWIDVAQAQSAAARAEMLLGADDPAAALDAASAALALVAEPLLPEFDQPWVLQARKGVDDLHSQLLELVALAGLRLGGARLADAERAALRLVERQPYRESGYALLMRCEAARGDVPEALRVFDRLRRTLMDQLGTVPSADVLALHRSLLRGDGPPAAQLPLPPMLARNAARPWVARAADLALLHERWNAVVAGCPGVVALVGEPGIGKTMLAARFGAELHERGATVLYGRADEEAVAPYSAFVEALGHYASHTPRAHLHAALGAHLPQLGALIGELAGAATGRAARGDPELRRLRLFQAVGAMLADAAAHGPTLLVLEDLHWADPGTLLMLRHVVRDAAGATLLVLMTYRDVETSLDSPLRPLIHELRLENELVPIGLAGFDDDDVALLLRRARHEQSPQLVRRLREHTSGNPLFVEEILRSAREGDLALGELDAGALDRLAIPEAIQDVIRRRLSRLSVPTIDALAAAAVLGRDFRLDALEAVLADDGEQALTAIDEALEARLVIEDPGHAERYAFGHALVRETIYRGLSRGRRARLHRRAALALEARRAVLRVGAGELAHHFVQAGYRDLAPEAIAYSREAAASSLQAHAYEEAARHYRRAVDAIERHRPHDAAGRCQALLELGAVAWQASLPDARAISQRAVEAARAVGGGAPLAEAALGLGGRFYAQVRVNRRTLDVLEEALAGLDTFDGAVRARLLARLAENLLLADSSRAQRLSAEAVQMAQRLGDDDALVAALLGRHASLLHPEHLGERLRVSDEVLALARDRRLRDVEALAQHWLLYDLFEHGEIARAALVVDELERLAGQLRQPLYRHSALVWRAVLEQLAARFDRVEELAREALTLADAAQAYDARAYFAVQMLVIGRDRGGLDDLWPSVEHHASSPRALWAPALAVCELERGNPDGAARALKTMPVQRPSELRRDIFWLPTLALLAEADAALGDDARAAELYALLAPHADLFAQLQFNGTLGSVHRQLGLLAGMLQEPRKASAHFAQALRRHEAIGAPALDARTCLDFAEAIRDGRCAGTPEQARRLTLRGLRLAEACGARLLAARAARPAQSALVAARHRPCRW